MTPVTVRLRFFASARAATGMDETTVDISGDPTIDGALAQLVAAPGETLEDVLARCSFLVDGVATTDRTTRLSPDDQVDVMPPFAGG